MGEQKEALDVAIKALEQEPCEDCISREAVIDINHNHYGEMPNHINHQIWEEINALPSIQPTTKENLVVGDCISRKAVMDYIKDCTVDLGCVNGTNMVLDVISNMPSVQPKTKTGHWIIKEGREQGYDIAGIKTWYIQIMCDKCGFIKTAIEGHTGQYHFCPNCGARMESEG